jgi:hypothetical protein
MSGFVLAQSALSTSFAVAEESVRFIDLMFGSNETSRALASIITLVAKELTDEDEEKSWTRWLMGGASSAVLARLTKSATLFACLQHRTFDRTKGEIMGRVLWDVTVSTRENDTILSGEMSQSVAEPNDGRLIQRERLSTELDPPDTEHVDAIDLDDAMTIVDAEEYAAVTSALPQSSIPQSTSTAFYEVMEEQTVTRTTTVRFINSTQRDARPTETRALQSRQVNTTTEKSKYKIAVQKVTDKLKVKKLSKPNSSSRPKITEIEDDDQPSPNAMKRALHRAKRGFSPNPMTNITAPKRRDSRGPTVSELDVPVKMEASNAPPIRSRDTKANILRTRAQTKSPEPHENTHLTTRVSTRPSVLPPRPPPTRNSSLYHTSEHDRDPLPSPTKLRRRRNSTVSICSFVSLRSDSHHQHSLLETSETNTKLFPPVHLVENLARFMRFSSACYGWNFMRLLGIGTLAAVVPSGSLHHANHHAFAQHTKLPLSNILLSSFSTTSLGAQTPQLVHFVSVDHEIGAVVLTCRGTLGVADILTDLACDYEDIKVYGQSYPVHKGMLSCAKQLYQESSRVCRVIKEAMETNPGYGLVLCGHSLVTSLNTFLTTRAAAWPRY